jgi:O-antigen/teichoic acid export membrane protein
MGAGVMGAVGSISLSVFAAYLLPAGDAALRGETGPGQVASFSEGVQAIIFFIGQVIISNIDILMVKHYFAPRDAGLYAAIALVGRLLYFATWSVTSAMFPVSAGQAVERESRKTVAVPLLFVGALSAGFVLLLAAFPDLVIGTLFGSGFHHGGMKLLLTMNAIATGTYALSVVLMTYEMSRRIANTGWLQLVVSGLVVAGVAVFHASLLEVIVVQQILRILLLFAVSVPFFIRGKASIQEAA